ALHEEMPWMAHNLETGPGGVTFAAESIAGVWESTWGRLLGDQPPTEAVTVYPLPGQRRLPTTGWNRNMQAGSDHGRGGARTRVAAVLSYSRPYDGSEGAVTTQLPAGSMTLAPSDTGVSLPNVAGWPRSVPYGPS